MGDLPGDRHSGRCPFSLPGRQHRGEFSFCQPGGLKWSSLDQLGAHFAGNAYLYVLQLLCWLIIFGIPARIMGIKGSRFIPSFIGLYILSVIMFALGGWVEAPKYNMEPPLARPDRGALDR